MDADALTLRLRRAGCVFAEEEAQILLATARDETELASLCARREAGEFLEHVVGIVDFDGQQVSVGPGVFVPRQRSALLAQEAVAAVRAHARPVVLEAYCGAAPIAARVARRLPAARIHAADADERALAHARSNLPSGAGVHAGDGLGALPDELAASCDVIAAVPPYVPSGSLSLMPREARAHEPVAALVGGDDGLDQVRRLIDEAPAWLAPGGVLLIEIHAEQTPAARARARRRGGYDGSDVTTTEESRTVVLHLRADGTGGRAAPVTQNPAGRDPGVTPSGTGALRPRSRR